MQGTVIGWGGWREGVVIGRLDGVRLTPWWRDRRGYIKSGRTRDRVSMALPYKAYYADLNRDDFETDEEFLYARVKKGLEVGYTFDQCFAHWLQDLADALECSEAGPVNQDPTQYLHPQFPLSPSDPETEEEQRQEPEEQETTMDQGTSV